MNWMHARGADPHSGFNRWAALRRPGRARRKFIALIVLLVMAVALAPLIVAKTPLRHAVLSAAVPGEALRVTAGEASLSWFGAPSLKRVEAHDEAGNLLLSVDSIALDRPLVSLLLNSRDLGRIELARPSLHVSIRPDGSNLEDVIQRALSSLAEDVDDDAASGDSTAPCRYTIRLVDGTIHAEDLAMSRKWRVEGINASYDARKINGGVSSGSFAARLIALTREGAADGPPGEVNLSLNPTNDGRQELSCQITNLTLSPMEAFLRRFLVAAELSGSLSGQGTAAWTPGVSTFPQDLSTTGMFEVERLEASTPALKGDRIRLARVELPWRIGSQSSGLAIQDLELRSDVGRIAIRGMLDSATVSQANSLAAVIASSQARHQVEVRGVLDVARLASMLPNMLRIRHETIVTSGVVNIAATVQPADREQRIAASIQTAQFAATSSGRPLRWEQPINAELTIARSETGARLESIRCESEFLQIAANGTPQDFRATAQFDLNRLGQELGQFVDLQGVELAGSGQGELEWKQASSNAFATRGRATVSGLRVASAGRIFWNEPQLELVTAANGTWDPATGYPRSVDTGKLNLRAESDLLEAVLQGPVSFGDANPTWPVSIVASGRLGSWLDRLRPWLSLEDWQIEGDSQLSANVRLASNAIEASDAKLSLANLKAANSSWNIAEPQVMMAGDFRCDRLTGELAAKEAQLVTSSVSLRVKDFAYGQSSGGDGSSGRKLAGAAAFRCDLGRLAGWRTVTDQLPAYRPQGELTGNVRFAEQNGRIIGELTANGSQLALSQKTDGKENAAAGGYAVIWQEPSASLRSLAAYEPEADRLAFKSLELQSNTLQLSAAGTVEKFSTEAEVNTTGTLNYDLAQLTPLVKPYIGEGIQLTGREQARFALAGTLKSSMDSNFQVVSLDRQSSIRNPQSEIHWSRRIRAQLELPWTGATIYGLPVGAGRASVALGDGAVRIQPLSLTVGQGQLTLAPQVRLDPPPSELALPAGPLVTNVRISPEVSEAMLKYVAPVLAGATESEGLFSMQLDGASVPLGELRRIDSAGTLTVHSVRVVPGPLAREWIGLAQQIETLTKRRDPAALASKPPVTLLSIRDQQVEFRVVEGRVHHKSLEFQVGDVVMRSQGSVGLDETLSLVLFVPIQDAWIAKEPLLAGLKGQSLQVPVAGTLTRPQLDQRAIASVSEQLLQSAAGQAIGNELNKALDKLFKQR